MSRPVRRVVFALFLLGTGSYAVVQLRGPDGLSDLQARYEKTRTLRQRLRDQENENEKLKKEIEKLNRKDHLDRVQRDEGRVPPGTVLFHVDEPKEEPSTAPPAPAR